MEYREYRRWTWFYSKLHLVKALAFDYHSVTYDPLPKTKEETFDEFYRAESTLQDKGWSSFSLNTYSAFEFARIRRFARKYPDEVFISPQTEFSSCYEVVAIIGETKTTCSGISVSPERLDELRDLFRSMRERPCLAIFESCSRLPKAVLALLKGKNYHVLTGHYGTAVSFEVIDSNDHDAITALAAQHSKRECAPPLKTQPYLTCQTTNYITYSILQA